jgi:hypothetical protein
MVVLNEIVAYISPLRKTFFAEITIIFQLRIGQPLLHISIPETNARSDAHAQIVRNPAVPTRESPLLLLALGGQKRQNHQNPI